MSAEQSPNAASRWDATDYIQNGAFVPALGAPVLALLDPQAGSACSTLAVATVF